MRPFEIHLLVCGWFAGTVAGVAGFGSAVLLLPLLTFEIGARRAVPVLTVAQLLGNLSRAGFGWREIQWKPALIFCVGAVPASLVGARVFAASSSELLPRIIGVVLLGVLCLRHSPLRGQRIPQSLLAPAGAVVGLLSAIAGTVGPLGAAVFLSLELPAAAYVATEAVTAVAMHLTKSVAYNRWAGLPLSDAVRGLALGGALVLGSWTGRKILSRMPPLAFAIVVESLLLISAAALILGDASQPGDPQWKN
jgi:uncharacterized membrane protein YfcA